MKMPCHITDDSDSEMPHNEEEDFDVEIQRRLDSGLCRWCGNHIVPDWGDKCFQCRVEEAELIGDTRNMR